MKDGKRKVFSVHFSFSEHHERIQERSVTKTVVSKRKKALDYLRDVIQIFSIHFLFLSLGRANLFLYFGYSTSYFCVFSWN